MPSLTCQSSRSRSFENVQDLLHSRNDFLTILASPSPQYSEEKGAGDEEPQHSGNNQDIGGAFYGIGLKYGDANVRRMN